MAEDQDIAAYEVSDDGLTWRPFDPARDRDGPLHKRIIFAAPGAGEPKLSNDLGGAAPAPA